MHITIIIGPFLPLPPKGSGAVEKLWHTFAQEAVRNKHKVHFITKRLKGQKTISQIKNIKITRLTNFNFTTSKIINIFLDFVYTLLIGLKKIDKTDIIISNTFWSPIILSFFKKCPIVADVGRIPKGQLKFYPNKTYFRANSRYVKKKILEEGISNKKIIFTPNFLINENIQKNKINNTNIKKKNIILYAGRIHKEKGLNLVLNSLKYLNKNIRYWKFIFVGPYEYEYGGGGISFLNNIKETFKNYNITFEYKKKIINQNKLNLLYKKSKIFLYPSVADKGETFGNSIIEAMACGCVPIVSNLKPFKDFIKNKKNGLLINHKNKKTHILLAKNINYLISRKKKIDYLSLNALNINKNYSSLKISNLFLNKIKKLVNN